MGKILEFQKRHRSPFTESDSAGNTVSIELGDSIDLYDKWPNPSVIVSDGPYGLSKFPGDPLSSDSLAELYAPHIAAWSKNALHETTLWFWCSEVGWAEVHPILKTHGWKYRAAQIWDK